jgi:hypothetical protein
VHAWLLREHQSQAFSQWPVTRQLPWGTGGIYNALRFEVRRENLWSRIEATSAHRTTLAGAPSFRRWVIQGWVGHHSTQEC